MTNPNIKFFRSNNAPSNPAEGYIWFNTEDRTIELYKNGDWEVYAGIVNATYENNVLTIIPAVGDNIVVDLNGIYTELEKLEDITGKVSAYVVSKIKEHEDARVATDTAFDERITAIEDELESLSGGAGSIATQINNAITALDLPNTYDTKGAAEDVLETVNEYTINGKKIVTNPILGASDINVSEGVTVAGKLGDLDSVLVTLVGDDSEMSVREIATEEVAKIVNETDNNSIDTLKEIAAWIADHPKDAAEYNARITANEQAIVGLDGRLETVETWKNELDVDGKISSAITGLDSVATASSDYATFTVAEVDGKVINEGSSISLTIGSFEEGSVDGLAVVSAVKAYVDNAWVWGEF